MVGERGPELFLPNSAGNVESMVIKSASTGVVAEPAGGGNFARLETFCLFSDEEHLVLFQIGTISPYLRLGKTCSTIQMVQI